MDSLPDDSFGSISPAEFFYRNRQMAGFGNPAQALFSTVRELVENSLDACDLAGVNPVVDIRVRTVAPKTYEVSVTDNGSGVSYEHVPEAFGRVLFGSKFAMCQQRGTFGLGVTMAVLYGQITTDSPVMVETKCGEQPAKRFEILIDVQKNRPVVVSESEGEREGPGTTVTIRLRGNLARSQERILDYVRLSTIVSPHVLFSLSIDDSHIRVGPHTRELPRRSRVCRPHPRAADVELLRRMISASPGIRVREFLVSSFQQLGTRTASRLLRFANIDPNRKTAELDRDDILTLSSALRSFQGIQKPSSDCLSPVGKEPMLTAVRSLFECDIAAYAVRGPTEWNGNPLLIEAVLCVARGFRNTSGSFPILYRFANRVPLLYDASGCVLTKGLRETNWSRYGIMDLGTPVILVHVCSTRIPYRAAGKQSIDTIPEIETEVQHLYRDLGRKLGRLSGSRARAARESRRLREFKRFFSLVVKYGAELADVPVPPTGHLVQTLFGVDIDE